MFYADGRSKGAVRQMLRKLLKHPDDIISITRTTSAELKKIRRGQIAGDEPGDEDEDKNPVGPSYNEAFGLPPSTVADKNLGAKINTAHEREQKRRARIDAKKIAAGKKLPYKKEAFEGPFSAPGSGSIAKPRKPKAGDENKSIEQQMADARKGSLAFQEDEWNTMWKNAAREKPKMSFKQATEFVDEVGLDKKEKINALKTAKKWLKT